MSSMSGIERNYKFRDFFVGLQNFVGQRFFIKTSEMVT